MPSDNNIWDNARELVRDNELDNAIELVECWLKGRQEGEAGGKARSWLDELLLHCASLAATERKRRQRLLSAEDADVEIRNISRSVLDLISEIERSDAGRRAPRPGISLPPAYSQGRFEKIIGSKSNLQMISWLEKGLERSTAVCRLVSTAALGTGFRIQNDLVVTNNHVIPDRDSAAAFRAEFFFEETLDGRMKDRVNIGLDPARFWTSPRYDMTIVGARFADGESESIRPIFLPSTTRVAVGDTVSIVQHPLGGPKQIALTANEVINLFEHRLQYVTDTLPGSSGAPIFDAAWNLVGVHHSGGDLLKNASGEHVFANEGTNVAYVGEIPEVKALLAARSG